MIISFISSVHIKRSIGNIVSSLTCANDAKSAVDGLVDLRLVAVPSFLQASGCRLRLRLRLQVNGCALGVLSIMKSRVYICMYNYIMIYC